MFDPTAFIGFHTWLSLIALGVGLVVMDALIRARNFPGWTALFLVTAIATSVTGFGFPFTGVLPSHVVGGVALVVLGVAIIARYGFHRAGAWRWIYAVAAITSVYLLAFVGIAQAFLKIPALRAIAPTSSEPLFAVTQLLVLALFIALAIASVRTSRPAIATKAYA